MFARWTLLLVTLLCSVGWPVAALAANEGQEELDRAIEARLSANNLRELGTVIGLCQTALDKGLDEENTVFCKKLLASTLLQRASMVSNAIFEADVPDPRWPQLRQVATADLERSLEHDPELAQSHYLLARLYALPGGDAKQAREHVEAALKLVGDDDETHARSLTLRSGMQEKIEDRLADLDAAIKLTPNDPQPLRARGAVRLAQNKPELALADFDAALEHDPDHAQTHEARGLALAMMQKMDEARASYTRAAELSPGSPAALIQRGRINLLAGDSARAVDDATAALKIDPDNPVALLLRAEAQQRQARHEAALEDVNKVLRQDEQFVPALRTRAVIYAAMNKLVEAIVDLEQVRQKDPDDVQTLFQLALLYNGHNEVDKAIQAFSAVIKLDPEQWMAYRGRADAYLSVGKQAEAIADYESGLRLRPRDAGMLNNLSWVLSTSLDEKLRDGRRALELATAACEVTDFKAAYILSTLAAAYAELGDFETAIKWSQKAIDLSDDDIRDNLEKELASYKAGKPWRELQSADDKPPGESKSPAPEDPGKPPQDNKPDSPGPNAAPDKQDGAAAARPARSVL